MATQGSKAVALLVTIPLLILALGLFAAMVGLGRSVRPRPYNIATHTYTDCS